MAEPHAQDETSFAGHADDEPVVPPAPANQPTGRDGGIEPAAPASDAPARALRRISAAIRRTVRR